MCVCVCVCMCGIRCPVRLTLKAYTCLMGDAKACIIHDTNHHVVPKSMQLQTVVFQSS